jgi:Ca-activated chloride channel homolog
VNASSGPSRRLTAVVVFVLVLVGVGRGSTNQPAGDQEQQPVFRAGVELVALNVTVTDSGRRYVTGLSRQDFRVLEDGVEPEISYFASGRVPLDLAILIDTSASMRDRLHVAQEAAVGFAGSLVEGDRGSVYEFSSWVRPLQTLTSDFEAIVDAINRTSASGGTTLYNALYVALKELASASSDESDVRRRAIVLLSDGDDTMSLIGFDDVLDLARRSGVVIYTITIRSEYDLDARLRGFAAYSRSQYEMRKIAADTGGRALFPAEITELAGAYQDIADELAHQYSLGYASNNPLRDGQFRRVVVQVTSVPNVFPRTRQGYFADRPAPRFGAGLSGDH